MNLFTFFFRRCSGLVLLAVAFSLPVQGQSGIYIEVESVPPAAPWEKRTDKPGYYGDCFYFFNSGSSGSPKGIMEYK